MLMSWNKCFNVDVVNCNNISLFVMRQHKMSRNVPNMDFELSPVSDCALHADSNGEIRFQMSQKMKKL